MPTGSFKSNIVLSIVEKHKTELEEAWREGGETGRVGEKLLAQVNHTQKV